MCLRFDSMSRGLGALHDLKGLALGIGLELVGRSCGRPQDVPGLLLFGSQPLGKALEVVALRLELLRPLKRSLELNLGAVEFIPRSAKTGHEVLALRVLLGGGQGVLLLHRFALGTRSFQLNLERVNLVFEALGQTLGIRQVAVNVFAVITAKGDSTERIARTERFGHGRSSFLRGNFRASGRTGYNPGVRHGLLIFFVALAGLALIRIGLGFLAVPVGLVMPMSVLVTAIFLAVPVYAVFAASSHKWTPKLAGLFVVLGLALHFGVGSMVRFELLGTGVVAAMGGAVAQTGFFLWCIGLGVLLATLLKEKNLLLPVSAFLAGFDIFLVLTPIGITQQIMKRAPEVLPVAGLNIPKPSATPTMGPVEPFAFVGPADFLFMGMFFVAIYRFNMRSRETALWMIPAILVYLLLALLLGPIPLLVPIGLVVLAVNWREFKLNKEEKLSTLALMAVLAGLIAFGATRPRPPAEPSPSEASPAPEESAGSLGQGVEDQGPPGSPPAGGSTPDPQ